MSAAAPAAEPTPKSGKKKFILIALVALVAAGGGGGGAWFFLGQKSAHAAEDAEKPKKKAAKPLFTTLEPFTVNLQDARGERFAQVGVTLQFEDPKIDADLKDRLPAVRNEILLLISSKQVEELLTTEGKQKLAEEIRARSAKAMGIEVTEVAKADKAEKNEKAEKAEEAAEDKDAKPAKKKKKAKDEEEVVLNPFTGVLFSQFIVQ